MSRPLEVEDPREVGPFRLTARLRSSAAGIVYLGVDPHGRHVDVALLTRAAAGDAAARDRFRAGILTEAPRPGAPAPPEEGGPAPVVAARPEGLTPWVATVHDEGRQGAERFLDVVSPRGGWSGLRRRGPQFQPHWTSGSKEPAVPGAEGPAAAGGGDDRGLVAAVISLVALLALLAVLLVLLFSCDPDQKSRPTPIPSSRSATAPPIPPPPSTTPPPSPSPGSESPTPGPTPSKTGGRSGPPQP